MGTDSTTTSGTPKPQPIDPRRILALVALADDLPVPHGINLQTEGRREPILSLHFNMIGDAARWASWFGITKTWTTPSRSGKRIEFEHADITWHGWIVYVFADELPSQLDADTRQQLEQVADVTPTGGA